MLLEHGVADYTRKKAKSIEESSHLIVFLLILQKFQRLRKNERLDQVTELSHEEQHYGDHVVVLKGP